MASARKTKSKKPSIYTISRELGVSPATVSRALNHHPAASASVRAKVQQIAAKYNYRPRVMRNRAMNLCVLIQQIDGHPLDFDPYLSRCLEGIALYCNHEELEMSLYSTHVNDLNRQDVVRELRRRGADGAIVLRANEDSLYFDPMDEQGFPYYCLLNDDGGRAARLLNIDNESLAQQAAEHLLSLGHRTIGILNNAPHSTAHQSRFRGYRLALEAHGIEIEDRRVVSANPKTDHGDMEFSRRGMQTLRQEAPDTTAVLAMSEGAARGALAWLFENDIRVPEMISVVGFDDFPDTAYTCPSLTTIRIPYVEIGYEGARQVHRLCRALDPLLRQSDRERLNGRLIVRKSTGPARTNV
ncbi:MAG: LacI family DNA-binding transcriptional regulator [Phycisphaerae bacterium]|nr:LacI family DNA-binding transcriptional regulator [Phycisphaerae bacterium]